MDKQQSSGEHELITTLIMIESENALEVGNVLAIEILCFLTKKKCP